jgi:serine/threonine-protein kinase
MSTPAPATISGRYRIDETIGRGGMSTVYRGFDTTLERPVAIKVMHRDVARDGDQLERFRREARAIAKLSSPYVVGVIDAGEEQDGTPFIVLEYVEGETLKDRIRRLGRLPVTEAVAYAIEIARGLQAAHERDIVHRDVKPQNVLLNEDGAARVTDFGIARSLRDEGLTADGRVLGTTDYVSPEQALGHQVTPQSDIYSLGIVLYEMLTGDVPFHGETQVSVAMHHVRDELPDVQAGRPEISSALAQVIDTATAKDLAERYAGAAALIVDLEEVLAIESARAGQITGEATAVFQSLPTATRRRVPGRVTHPSRWLIAVALIAILVVAAFVLLADRTRRGTGTSGARAQPGYVTVPLGQSRAKDYDPIGGDGEHPENASAVLDRSPNSSWDTETYLAGNLAKDGVGIAVDAKPRVAARQIRVDTSTPGWSGAVYAAESGSSPPATIDDPAWVQVGSIAKAERRTRVNLDTAGKAFRWYLVWIERFAPGQEKVEISEIYLYR